MTYLLTRPRECHTDRHWVSSPAVLVRYAAGAGLVEQTEAHVVVALRLFFLFLLFLGLSGSRGGGRRGGDSGRSRELRRILQIIKIN